jgi:hypothetical protein
MNKIALKVFEGVLFGFAMAGIYSVLSLNTGIVFATSEAIVFTLLAGFPLSIGWEILKARA